MNIDVIGRILRRRCFSLILNSLLLQLTAHFLHVKCTGTACTLSILINGRFHPCIVFFLIPCSLLNIGCILLHVRCLILIGTLLISNIAISLHPIAAVLIGFLITCLETVVIDLLLLRCQRLIYHFQFHGHSDIFTESKPKDQLITGLHTFGCKAALVIQFCELIHPFFLVFYLFQLLQHFNLLINAGIKGIIQLILQNIAPGIPRRQLLKLLVKLSRFHRFSSLTVHLT